MIKAAKTTITTTATTTTMDSDTQGDVFARRHIGLSSKDQKEMLAFLGYSSMPDLMAKVIPAEILQLAELNLPAAKSEPQVLQDLKEIAQRNELHQQYIGEGYYGTHTPSVILRNVLENPAWYTAYTPYQPEISQGRLEVLLLFQTMICDLTGLAIANASLLDEASACAEAMSLCARVNRGKSDTFFVDEKCLPQSIAVLHTRARAMGLRLHIGPLAEATEQAYFGALLRYPNVDGRIEDFSALCQKLSAQNTTIAMATDLLALCLLKPPAEFGADVVVGSSQRFGVPIGGGGPHAGFIAVKQAYTRNLPGRLVGLSRDTHERPAYRLALQTREQHIRRQTATSNICTAQTLPALLASFYAIWHGAKGLQDIAQRVNLYTRALAHALTQADYTIVHTDFFDTLVIACGSRCKLVRDEAERLRVNLRWLDNDRVGISLDETTTLADLKKLLEVFAIQASIEVSEAKLASSIPPQLVRTSKYLQHSSFQRYHSETEMMRYLRHLANLDIGLDTSMIPLGSCTMKLNAATEMIPITWPEFALSHPHAPENQLLGYGQIVADLENWLCQITGYDAVSLQPNAGSQGEFAGILAVKSYYQSLGQEKRNVCLIPQSAHGTNPASATMCAMKVVSVECDQAGNINMTHLKECLNLHHEQLALMMITYPSTHGVFEENIVEICDLVHQHGGQIYMDGANLNAMVGLCYPGKFGCDVSHLNLHKTFCIPHGGGGPGVGPVCVRQHLVPYLPKNPISGSAQSLAVAGAPWGSASILPISWSYIALMGKDGLRQASQCAILSANYIAHKLKPHYPLLYTNTHNCVAHECILDMRPFKASVGIEVDDIAKRLIDYSFHPPTMSFPIPGTLMIEPTESESKAELDRFIAAMIAIRSEIAEIETKQVDPTNNVLKNAPHTLHCLIREKWSHPYSPERAAWPVDNLSQRKHWAPVTRIDQVYGDKNLCCRAPEDQK